jgi:N-acyl-D-amino-acid deacylase
MRRPLRGPIDLLFLCAAVCLPAFAAGCSHQPDFDVVVRGGTIYDGTGELSGVRQADVGITGDRIRAIGDLGARRGAVEINATGKAVAPGFIDAQSRSGITLLANGEGDSHLRQGITSEILADGSPALWTSSTATSPLLERYGVTFDWNGLSGYFAKLESRGTAINVGTLVPLSLARAAGNTSTFIDAAMRDGAFGIVDDVNAAAQELSAAAASTGRSAGIAMVHADSQTVASDDAIVALGTQVRRLVIADVSRSAPAVQASELIGRIARALSRKADVMATAVPYPPAPGESDAGTREALKFGSTLVVTDAPATSAAANKADVRPAAFGAFPRWLAMTREEGNPNLREAVRRVTSAAAALYDLPRRGIIREDYYADIVVFDPMRVSDRASFEKPNQYPVGINYVIVNGVIELTPQGVTGARAGTRLLRRSSNR